LSHSPIKESIAILRGPPESFGWQRRPDMDTAFKGATTGIAYEKPDGSLYLFPPNRKPELMRLKLKMR
jgi:hypothetical protein